MDANQKADRARTLLADGILSQVLEDIQSDISLAWKACADTTEREKLWYLQEAVGKVNYVLEGYVAMKNFEDSRK